MKESNASALYRILATLFSTFITFMFVCAIFENSTVFPRFKTVRMLMFLGIVTLVMLLCILCIRFMPRKMLFIFVSVACFCVFIVQIWFTVATYTLYGWDCGAIILGAGQLVNGSLNLPTYFAQYPNNEALLLFFERVFSLSHALGMMNDALVAALVAVLCTDAAIAFGVLCARRLLSREGAYLYLALSAFMVGMNMWAQVPYTDTCGMFFPPLLLYIWLRVRACTCKSRRLFLCVLLGTVSLLAMKVKPQGIIIVIAILLIESFSHSFKRPALHGSLPCVAGILCSFLVASALFTAYRDAKLGPFISSEMRARYEFPVTQQLMMGARQEEVEDNRFFYGAWNKDDVSSTAERTTLSERTKYTLQEYVRRVKELGVLGYLRFLYGKACWVYADGTFFYGGISAFRYTSKPPVKTKLSRLFQSIAYEDLPRYQNGYAYFSQGFWLFTMALCVVSFLGTESDPRAFSIIRLALLGLTLSILLFEGRSRYLLMYLPLFTLMAAKGLDGLFGRVFKY